MSVLLIIEAILGLAFLMVIHEGGHYLVAKYFGMRVIRFSIGFGPAIYKHKPEGSDTTYQIAIIPFLAYVQIDGMNPFDEIDPNDKASYANASLFARAATIFAGPLANYLVASVLFFAALIIGGKNTLSTTVDVQPGGAAAAAHIQSGDKIVEIDGVPIEKWKQVHDIISVNAGKPLPIVVERDGKRLTFMVAPEPKGEHGEGRIGIISRFRKVPVTTGEAAWLAVRTPAVIVVGMVQNIAHMIAAKIKPQLSGPVGIVNEMKRAAKRGFSDFLGLLGIISAYLAGFNLLPFPALDGGRLMFLAYEATTRKRANERVEARIHMVGLIMLLTLMVAVTIFDVAKLGK